MRLHHYPGLFGDPRSRGLTLAVGVSLLVHVVLLITVGRIHTRPVERTFFTPVHMVDLVERPTPPAKSKAAAAPAKPAAKEATPAVKKASPPKPTPPPKPAPQPQAAKKVPTEPAETPTPEPEPEVAPEQRISDRIARFREKYGNQSPPPGRTEEVADPGAEDGRVESAIDSIRKRMGTAADAGAATGTESERVGVRRSGANTLQQVRLRAYYNQLWDHVTSHWAIPPSLQGRDYAVIVSVVIDRQGNLVRSWVEEPSPSEAFDQSALRALQRAQPLPPIPDSVAGDTLEVGFRFHPD